MRMPGCARAGLKRDAGAADARRIGRLEQRVDADCACEPLGFMCAYFKISECQVRDLLLT
jgi:hypothetical protein